MGSCQITEKALESKGINNIGQLRKVPIDTFGVFLAIKHHIGSGWLKE